MKSKIEGAFAITAALFVLFSAMWDARISIAISIIALVAFGVYKLVQKEK
jgi:hypothetical protein